VIICQLILHLLVIVQIKVYILSIHKQIKYSSNMKYETTVSLVLVHFYSLHYQRRECLLKLTAHKFPKASAPYLGFATVSI
jgi:hypothetical protein